MPVRKQLRENPGRVTPVSLSRTLSLIGDPWTLSILRAAFMGTVRFRDFRHPLGIPKQTLAARLAKLAENAVLYKVPVKHTRLFYEYHLTPKGLDLYSLILMIWRWHCRWHLDESILPAKLYHRDCGHVLEPVLRCAGCHGSLECDSVEFQAVLPMIERDEPKRRARILNEWEELGDNLLAAVVIGDGWSLLVLNAVLRGVHNYDALQKALSISSNVLAARLKTLVSLQLLQQQQSTLDGRMSHYAATRKAEDIYPIILSLIHWGNRWLAGAECPPDLLKHTPCGEFLFPELCCNACGNLVRPSRVSLTPVKP